MIQFAAYLQDQDLDHYEMKEPFLVHSCGRISFTTGQDLEINRIRGRKDYQIIYVHRGAGHFYYAGVEQVLPAGSIVLYEPGECQKYSFYVRDEAEFYWLHFSGTGVEELFLEAGISKKQFFVGSSTRIFQLFEMIIQELMFKKRGYFQLSNLKGQELVFELSRACQKLSDKKEGKQWERLEKLIARIHLEYHKPLKVEALAREYGASSEWFIKIYTKYTGMTPKHYINELRMNHARELLLDTDDTIGKIAVTCGFQNPLYFSNYFQKRYHMSPSEYRENGRAL